MTKEKAIILNKEAKGILMAITVNCFNKGWARLYIEAEKPIPTHWRDAFIDELTSPDEVYRKELEESVRYFGVRWV